MERETLIAYLDQYLHVPLFTDYAPNGLQIEGRPQIQRICTAVTASYAVIQAAMASKADALLVHHGYFWKGESPQLLGMKRKRIQALLSADINLFAYHLPLDCHPLIGNNARLGHLLQVEDIESFTVRQTPHLLWSGVLPAATTFDAFKQFLACIGTTGIQSVQANDQPIRKIAWCSGAAQDFIEDAAKLGVDAYISGEVSERTYYQAKELGLHYFACGHHATERHGIRALGEHLTTQFGLDAIYMDSDNPF